MKNTNGSRGLLLFIAIVFVFLFPSPSFADTGRYLSDDANRLRWVEYGSGKVVQYTYDGEGNLLQRLVADPLPADVSVSTAWDDFGTKAAGGGAINHSITINNNGSSSLIIGSITSDGTTTNFTLPPGNDTCSNQTIAASGSCTFQVSFTPQTQVLSGFYVNVPSNKPTFKVLVGGETVASLPSKAITINNDDDYTTSGSVTLSVSAPSYPANISQVCVSNTASCSSWVDYSGPTQLSWGLTSGDGIKAVYVKFRNASLTTSPTYFDSIYLETVAPTGSIVINGGATYTNSTSVTVGLTGADAGSGAYQMRFSGDGINWSSWEAYETSRTRTLTQGDGSKSIYVQYRDHAGNISVSYSDTIILDTTPANPVNFHIASYQLGTVNLAWNANTEGDLAGYKIYYGPSSRSYTGVIAVGNVTSYALTGVTALQYYYLTVTAYDASSNESGYSNETGVTFPLSTYLRVFGAGQWYADRNGNGAWDDCGVDICIASFGQAGNFPVVGDWTGTGTAKIGVFQNGDWYLDLNGNGVWDGCGTDACYASFGQTGDLPVAGDWTGSGTDKIGVFRNGQWFLDLNGNGVWDGCGTDACIAAFGQAGNIPVVGDWTGTGTAKIGVFQNGGWYLDLNGNGVWDGCGTDACYTSFGQTGDLPVVGDWTGNGRDKIGVYRNGAWYLDRNGNGAWDDCVVDICVTSFGSPGNIPMGE